jgi:hypothetical protein
MPMLHLSKSRYVPVALCSGWFKELVRADMEHTGLHWLWSRAGSRQMHANEAGDSRVAGRRAQLPQWVEANADAQGYYRVDYQDGLLNAFTKGNATAWLNAAERVELMGTLQAMGAGGRRPEADALRLAESLHDDPERHVVRKRVQRGTFRRGRSRAT